MSQPKISNYRLTPDDVIAIRQNREGMSDEQRAAHLGVHLSTVRRARSGETWASADIKKTYDKKKPKTINNNQKAAMQMKASDICDIIEQSRVYRSGKRFSPEELLRSMSTLKYMGLNRIKILLNRMADNCKLDKIREAESGNEVVYYCRRCDSRALISRPWVKFSTQEYTPRYY